MTEQGRSRGRAEAWRPWIAAGRRPALAWPQGLTDFARRTAQPRTDVRARLGEHLERVRVSVRKGTAPAVGSFVELKARLSPPLEPLRPGGYDFARDMYFQ